MRRGRKKISRSYNKVLQGALSCVLFFFVFFAPSVVFSAESSLQGGYVPKVIPPTGNAIDAIAANREQNIALRIISIQEGGWKGDKNHPTPIKSGFHNPPYGCFPKGTDDWGIMQINDLNIGYCATGSAACMPASDPRYKAYKAKLMDPATGVEEGVRCAKKVLEYNTGMRGGGYGRCGTLEAALCAYNAGRGWCLPTSARGGKGRANYGCGFYSVPACKAALVNCKTGAVGKNPITGEESLKTAKPEEEVFICADAELAIAMEQASREFSAKSIVRAHGTFEDSAKASRGAGPGGPAASAKYLRGKIGDAYCIQVMYDFMNIARLVTEWKSIVGAAIEAIVNQIVNQIMSWVCQNIAAAVDWALTLICLPLPDLGFSLDLPTLNRKSCNGLSLQTLMQVTPGNPVEYPVEGPTNLYDMARAIPTKKGEYRFP